MPPFNIDALKEAIARRVGVERPTPAPAPTVNPNILRLIQLIQMARQNKQPGEGLALGHIKQQMRGFTPPGLTPPHVPHAPITMNAMPVGSPVPMQHPGNIVPEEMPPITKLPQQHSQIGMQAPYQAFGSNPMQMAAQNRLQKKNVGMAGGQGNFGNTSTGGGTESNPAGVKQPQQKHRKVTIEEYR